MEGTKTSKVMKVLKKIWEVIKGACVKTYGFIFADVIRFLILLYGCNVVIVMLGGNVNTILFGIQSFLTMILLIIYKYKK